MSNYTRENLSKKNLVDLRKIAKDMGATGYSRINKPELINLITNQLPEIKETITALEIKIESLSLNNSEDQYIKKELCYLSNFQLQKIANFLNVKYGKNTKSSFVDMIIPKIRECGQSVSSIISLLEPNVVNGLTLIKYTKCEKSNKKSAFCSINNCYYCYYRSFVSSDKCKFWNKEKNGDIDPRKVSASSHKICYFDCPTCNHTFENPLYRITDGGWCPYCSSNILCEDEACKYCGEKSFASHPRCEFWNYEKNIDSKGLPLTPRMIFKNSNYGFWFKCDVCKHDINMILVNITYNDTWCKYCGNQELCDNPECNYCLEKSFHTSSMSKYWDYEKNNKVTPRMVFKHDKIKRWFVCYKCTGNFCLTPSDVTKGHWCSVCKNVTESELYFYIRDNLKLDVEKEVRFQWCKNKNPLPFDFVIEDLKLIIELDAYEHFRLQKEESNADKRIEVDTYKMQMALDRGYSIIRFYNDFRSSDKLIPQVHMTQYIKKYDEPTLIFITNKPKVYDNHKFDKDGNSRYGEAIKFINS